MTIDFNGVRAGRCARENHALPAAGNYHCGRCHKEKPVAEFHSAGGPRCPNGPGNCEDCQRQERRASKKRRAARRGRRGGGGAGGAALAGAVIAV